MKNYALILAGGVGQRMRSSGLPKQFLMVYGKPIIIYTIEKFVLCPEVNKIVVACNPLYIDYLKELLLRYPFEKEVAIISGGKDRQGSIQNGIDYIFNNGGNGEDIIIVHDGVRPLIDQDVISENIRVAEKEGCAMTVRPVVESVVVSDNNIAQFEDFKKRDNTYSLTSPQTFKLSILVDAYEKTKNTDAPIPLLDAALAYTYLGHKIPLVMEYNQNIKITTPEDYYVLKALLELQENKNVFGLN